MIFNNGKNRLLSFPTGSLSAFQANFCVGESSKKFVFLTKQNFRNLHKRRAASNDVTLLLSKPRPLRFYFKGKILNSNYKLRFAKFYRLSIDSQASIVSSVIVNVYIDFDIASLVASIFVTSKLVSNKGA